VCFEAGVKAAVCSEAGDKAVACSRAGDEVTVCSVAGIEDSRWLQWHDGSKATEERVRARG
jgi:hypothetical protein